jgi:hypothetical protein
LHGFAVAPGDVAPVALRVGPPVQLKAAAAVGGEGDFMAARYLPNGTLGEAARSASGW